MEFLVVLLLLGMLALWTMLLGLRGRIATLEQRLAEGAAALAIETPAEAVAAAPAAAMPGAPEREIVIEAEPEPAPARETLGALFERLVAGRLLVWLGGVALVVAAILLIRYSIEIGLVTPAARMIGAGLFGLSLVGAGEYARRARFFALDPRIAQALVGAGLAILYATTYGSHVLHGLIGAGTATVLMLAVSASALGLSLRHGAPTAIMGLAGGFLTPALVGDPDAGAAVLLAYLALLDLAIWAIAWRQRWTWLAAAAAALSFLWAGYLISGPVDDALLAGLFVALLAIGAGLVRPGTGRELALIQPLAIGLVLLAFLLGRADTGALAWSLYGALAAASLALAARREEYWPAAPLACFLALALLIVRTAGGDAMAPAAAAGATLLFGFAGIAMAARRASAIWTAIGAAGFAGPALILRASRPEWLEPAAWGLLMLALAAGPSALAWANRRAASREPPGNLCLLAAGAAAATLLGAAAWDLLPAALVPAGWLAAALMVGLAARRLDDFALGLVATLTAAVAVTRAAWMAPELSGAVLMAMFGEPVLTPDLPSASTAVQSLALPALLLGALWWVLRPLPLRARRALPVAAGLFALAAAYVLFKQAFGLATPADFFARGMLERTILTQSLFAAGALMALAASRNWLEPGIARWGAAALTAVAAARLMWLDLVAFNPAWREQWVGTMPLLNLVTAQYLLGAVWLYLARRRAEAASRSGFWLAAFFAALVGGTALLVRQAFQGPILSGPALPTAEFYSYSLAGIVVAIGLLLAGIRLPDKALRLAGLVLLTATIFKVFLIDARALEGVWRVLSFLGLGVALIGIGRLYGPVLRAQAGPSVRAERAQA